MLAPPRLLAAFLAAAALLPSLHAGGRVAAAFDALEADGPPDPTRLRVLAENDEAWYYRWHLLENARESLDVTYYILADDVFGKAMLGALLHKARQGVRVRLLVDARGSGDLARRRSSQAYLRALAREPAAEVRVFKPLHRSLRKLGRSLKAVIASNHDKILLADGRRAVSGGRNVSWYYFASPEDDPHAYRDTDVLTEGAVAGRMLARAFAEEFSRQDNYAIPGPPAEDLDAEALELDLARRAMGRWMSGRGLHAAEGGGRAPAILRELNQELERFPSLTGYARVAGALWRGERPVPARVLDKHSWGDPRNDITPNMIRLLDAAETRIVIQNAYFVATKEVMDALQRAAARGVEVVVHTNSPASTNSALTQAFFVRDWWKVLRDVPTMRLFVFEGDQKVHAKTLVLDDEVLAVSSYNVDPMSEEINGEIMVVARDGDAARRHRLRIERDIEASKEYRIRRLEGGEVEVLSGPAQHLKGPAGAAIQVLKTLRFLRPLV